MMMAKLWCIVIFAILVELQEAFAANNAALQKVFEQLLEVPTKEPKDHHGQPPIPQYMMELYERLRNGHVGSWNGSNKNSDIVRSIAPMKEKFGRKHILVYNLHRVTDEEEVFHAELHFFRKKSHKWSTSRKSKMDVDETKTPQINNNTTDFRLRIVDVSRSHLRLLDTISMAHHGRGWKIQDISRMFLQCRASKGQQHLLGVQFQALSGKSGKYRSVAPSRVVNMDTQPFLVVFSNRTNPVKSINLLEMQTQLAEEYQDMDDENAYPEDNNDHLFGDDSEQDTIFKGKRKNQSPGNILKRVPRSVADNHVPEGSRGWAPDQRVSRSIYDNELPDNTVRATIIHQTSPGVLRSRSESRQRATDPSIIPYPSSSSSRANGSRRGNRRKNGGKKQYNDKQRDHRRLPKLWQRVTAAPSRHINDATADLDDISDQDDYVCRRRKLVVDFADIGWGEWIISPKSFEAHYCAGACPFPLTKELRPSNHATIQSIVNAIGLQPHVPPPCCVADSMSSVTLLYFDEDRNVVLKNYPGMTVESCACR